MADLRTIPSNVSGVCLLAACGWLLTACGASGSGPGMMGQKSSNEPGSIVATSGADTSEEPSTTGEGGAAMQQGGDRRARATGVLVDVGGAVQRPGVYELGAGTRVHEAIEAAGGVIRGADVSSLNRAAPIIDGQQVVVPRRAPQGGGSGCADESAPATGGGAVPGSMISLNSADAAALDDLPGIGPVTARNIVDDRAANGPFSSVDDLDRVPGIGAATIDELRAAATI